MIRISVILFLLSSCLRVNQIEGLNNVPEISINDVMGTYLSDSIKLSKGSGVYHLRIVPIDADNNVTTLRLERLLGNGVLFKDGLQTQADEFNVKSGEPVFMGYRPLSAGTHILLFTASDSFNDHSTTSLELTAFNNLKPEAVFTLLKPPVQFDPLEYLIDASGSKDADLSFGGGLDVYEYSFIDKTVQLSRHSINIIFPNPGIYEVGLRVRDNDGEWSEKMLQTYEIK